LDHLLKLHREKGRVPLLFREPGIRANTFLSAITFYDLRAILDAPIGELFRRAFHEIPKYSFFIEAN
jgi:hypothetical protein